MADNITAKANTGAGVEVLAADDIGGVLYPRIKVTTGADGVAGGDVTPTNPFPVKVPNATPGTIGLTAVDAVVAAPANDGVYRNGASTAGAIASQAVTDGQTTWRVQTSGTFTTTVYFEGSIDSTNGTDGNWIALQGRREGMTASTVDYKTTANAQWIGALAGCTYFRVRAVGGAITSLNIKMQLTSGIGTILQSGALAAGTNLIGAVSVDNEGAATFRGRAQSFRTPGAAGTAGQKIFALHNATSSTKIVHVNQFTVDLMQTVVKAITVAPPVIRLHRFTAIPSGGTALTKVAKDTTLTSNASITAWGAASADGTGTTLTVTIPSSNILTQEFAPRFVTAAGYEPFDRAQFLDGADIVLRALEGVVVELVYTLATQNPTTDMWLVGCDWYEV